MGTRADWEMVVPRLRLLVASILGPKFLMDWEDKA
jgi:hypothetical protein